MESLTLNGKLTSALTVLIAALLIVFVSDLKNVIYKFGFKKSVLVIGILSSPENFESRKSIRGTWLNFSSDFSITYHFILGKQLCDIHPLDRVSPFSCVEHQLSLPENATSETEFSVLSRKEESKMSRHSGKVGSIGFGFEILRDVTVTKLGLLRCLLNYVGEVRVKLGSSDTLMTWASVTITRDIMSGDESDFVMKSITPVYLERNTEARLIIEFGTNEADFLPNCDDFQWNYTPGVINYVQLIQFGERKPWPFSSDSCTYVSMNYKIADVDSVKIDLFRKKEREKEWKKRGDDIYGRLVNESNYYGDLMFVDVVDVYRNLPKKLVQFFQRLVDAESFHFVLKTDDDTFIDVARVYRQLSEVSNNEVSCSDSSGGKLWWWSSYREFWKVQETGKWRDDDYRSPAYPSFPCGGGYVLNKRIVEYLSENEHLLQLFQGEDVSVGIWLSALKTVQHRTRIPIVSDLGHVIQEKIVKNARGEGDWIVYLNSSERKQVAESCEWTCDNEMDFRVPRCNKVQLTPAEMYEVWDLYTRQGFV